MRFHKFFANKTFYEIINEAESMIDEYRELLDSYYYDEIDIDDLDIEAQTRLHSKEYVQKVVKFFIIYKARFENLLHCIEKLSKNNKLAAEILGDDEQIADRITYINDYIKALASTISKSKGYINVIS